MEWERFQQRRSHHTRPGEVTPLVVNPHLGSAICADCFTRPQYVDKSYCEAGRSRLPGNDADIEVVPQLTCLYLPSYSCRFMGPGKKKIMRDLFFCQLWGGELLKSSSDDVITVILF